MIIIPKGLRLLIEVDAVKEKKTGEGIWLPDEHEETTRYGVILAKGKDVKMYEVGDRVAVNFMAGTDLHDVVRGILKDTHRLIVEDNIICQIKEEDIKGIKGQNEEE